MLTAIGSPHILAKNDLNLRVSMAMKHVTTYIDIYGAVLTMFMVLVDATGVVQS
jgi:hypothetical protein